MTDDRLIFLKITSKNIPDVKAFLDANNKSLIVEVIDYNNVPDFVFLGPKYQKEYFKLFMENSLSYGYFRNEVCHILEDKNTVYKYINKNIKKLETLLSKVTDDGLVLSLTEAKDVFDRLKDFVDKTKKSDVILVISI